MGDPNGYEKKFQQSVAGDHEGYQMGFKKPVTTQKHLADWQSDLQAAGVFRQLTNHYPY
jgi:hypothetical protein